MEIRHHRKGLVFVFAFYFNHSQGDLSVVKDDRVNTDALGCLPRKFVEHNKEQLFPILTQLSKSWEYLYLPLPPHHEMLDLNFETHCWA